MAVNKQELHQMIDELQDPMELEVLYQNLKATFKTGTGLIGGG